MMEAVCTSETSVNYNVITRCHIPEGSKLHTRHLENLKSHKHTSVQTKTFIKEDEMGRARSTHGAGDAYKVLVARDQLVDGDELKNPCEGVEWIHLAQHTVPV
jgi:hypothetical protein